MSLSKTSYTVRVRDASLNPQGIIHDYSDLLITLRMNDVGKWSMTVGADNPLRQYFTRGCGIIITRDLGDGVTPVQTVCSGPIWDVVRKGRDNVYLLSGPTDEIWLKYRNALPAGGRPYMEAAMLLTPLRYYRLDEASGTVGNDTSLSKQNGTYSGGVTFNVAGGVSGDPDTAVTFNGTTGLMTFPTAGLPTGNAPWTLVIAFNVAAYPAANAILIGYGANAAQQVPNIYMNPTGGVVGSKGGPAAQEVAATAAVTKNVWHQYVMTWDGTTLTGYLDNVLIGTNATGGAMAIPGTGLSGALARNPFTSTGFFGGSLDEAMVLGVTLTAAQVAALWAAFSATHATYDTRTGQVSGVLIGYVNANVISPVNVDRDMTFMSAAADPATGTTVTGNARYDNLLALLQQLASAGGDIGFRVVQTANGVLQFQVYAPNDKTSNAKFSQDIANLFDYAYDLTGPNSNSAEVLGGGTNAGRTAVRVNDATSIANWGMVEGPIVDARDTSDTATMTQRGTAETAAQSEQINLSITPRDTDSVTYGRDYNLGDIVTIQIDGATITNKIRSVELHLTDQEQEIVTPGIGNPTQGQAAQFLADYQRGLALQRVQAAITRLNGAQ